MKNVSKIANEILKEAFAAWINKLDRRGNTIRIEVNPEQENQVREMVEEVEAMMDNVRQANRILGQYRTKKKGIKRFIRSIMDDVDKKANIDFIFDDGKEISIKFEPLRIPNQVETVRIK